MRATLTFTEQDIVEGRVHTALDVHKALHFIFEWEQLMRSGWKRSNGRVYDAVKDGAEPEVTCDSLSEVWYNLKDDCGILGMGE